MQNDIYTMERVISMDKNELQKRLLEDNDIEHKYLCELKSELDEEINKPIKKRDLNKIEELTRSIRELTDSEQGIRQRTEEDISAIMARSANEKRAGGFQFRRLAAALCVCFVAVIGLNLISFHAWGTNMFSAAYRLMNGGISIDMNERIELPTTADDPYGMKTKCAEYGMYPETPSYIPEGFRLIHVDDVKKTDSIRLTFYYKKEGINLHFVFFQYYNKDQIPPVGIPTDTYNVVEEEINNHKMYILKEDNQFTAIFQSDNIVYSIASDGLNYDECQKVIESLD